MNNKLLRVDGVLCESFHLAEGQWDLTPLEAFDKNHVLAKHRTLVKAYDAYRCYGGLVNVEWIATGETFRASDHRSSGKTVFRCEHCQFAPSRCECEEPNYIL